MTDKDIWAVKAGPVVIGGVTERKPESPLFRLTAWIITVLLLASQAPLLGVVLIIGTAIYLAAKTAQADDERKPR